MADPRQKAAGVSGKKARHRVLGTSCGAAVCNPVDGAAKRKIHDLLHLCGNGPNPSVTTTTTTRTPKGTVYKPTQYLVDHR